MLSVNEIRNLEERWKKYKRKKYKNIVFFSLIILSVVVIVVLFNQEYFNNYFKKDNKPKRLNTAKHSLSLVQDNKNIKKSPKKIVVKAVKVVKKKILQNEQNKTKSSNKLKLNLNKITKNSSHKNLNIDNMNSSDNNDQILTLDNSFIKHIYVSEKETNSSKTLKKKAINKHKTQNTDTLKKVISTNDAKKKIHKEIKKTKIIIYSKKIDKLKYLKDRYNESGKAIYAVLISKEYYKKKMYKKSLTWAMIANNIDSSNEDSWIMFAKSSIKLGKKDDAINALRAYLSVNSSKSIETLLFNIKNGVFK